MQAPVVLRLSLPVLVEPLASSSGAPLPVTQKPDRHPIRSISPPRPNVVSRGGMDRTFRYRNNAGICLINRDGLAFVARRFVQPKSSNPSKILRELEQDIDDGKDLAAVATKVSQMRSISRKRTWQMPQGGINKGEDPAAAASRELLEETGVSSARIVAKLSDELRYDYPPDVLASRRRDLPRKRMYRGQRQSWFLMLFEGPDSEVNLNQQENPEFEEWQWMLLSELPQHVAHFKGDVYQAVIEEFSPLIQKHLVHGQWR